MRRSLWFRVVPAFAVMVFAAYGCGVQEHPIAKATPATGSGGAPGLGGAPATGTGGQPAAGLGGSGGAGTSSAGGQSGGGGVTGAGGAPPVTGAGGGPGIMINGAFVPKDKAVVFIHFGHSNMRGQASRPASLMSYFYNTQAGLWMYLGQAKGGFVPAKEPTAPEPGITLAGPGMAILRAAQTAAAPGYQFISIGRGNGSSPSTDFLKANALFYPDVMNRALELKGKVTFGGVFIMLGITERHLPTADQPGYPARMKQIISDIRADLGEPNLPILYCDYEQKATGDLAPTGAVGVVIFPLTRSLPGMISNLVLVPTSDTPGVSPPDFGMMDDHHFDFSGHKIWSDRAIALMKTNNWFPWTK
jgi:Carbohydrate esterase, sialic acid-specific acetylesterase